MAPLAPTTNAAPYKVLVVFYIAAALAVSVAEFAGDHYLWGVVGLLVAAWLTGLNVVAGRRRAQRRRTYLQTP